MPHLPDDGDAENAPREDIAWTVPLYMTRTDKPDLAAALSIQEGYYIAHALISLEAAYQYARSLARPSSRWLTSIVCTT